MTTRPKLNQYAGPLSHAQVAAGMNAAIRNARRLADDAKLLLEAKRYASAMSLAALSVEESGKVSILRALALARNDEDVRRSWKEYRTHTKKNVAWLLPELAAKGARSLDDLRPLFENGAEHPIILDQLKQINFYTDCLGSVQWSEPDQAIDADLARSLVRTADLLAKGREVTVREIELWVEHIKPVWMGKLEWMKKALSNWRPAMQAEGLAVLEADRLDKFIWGGTPGPPATNDVPDGT